MHEIRRLHGRFYVNVQVEMADGWFLVDYLAQLEEKVVEQSEMRQVHQRCPMAAIRLLVIARAGP